MWVVATKLVRSEPLLMAFIPELKYVNVSNLTKISQKLPALGWTHENKKGRWTDAIQILIYS